MFESEICRVQQPKTLYYSASTPKRKKTIILIIEITFTGKPNLKSLTNSLSPRLSIVISRQRQEQPHLHVRAIAAALPAPHRHRPLALQPGARLFRARRPPRPPQRAPLPLRAPRLLHRQLRPLHPLRRPPQPRAHPRPLPLASRPPGQRARQRAARRHRPASARLAGRDRRPRFARVRESLRDAALQPAHRQPRVHRLLLRVIIHLIYA